jgi:hypothetical protein
MNERQEPGRDSDPPQIETPVIDIQDLEHNPAAGSRVNNSGVQVRPTIEAMFAREDEKAREAVAEFEKLLKSQPPD